MQQERIQLSSAGVPMIFHVNTWRELDFNRIYAGFYPQCRFTAVTDFQDTLYLAGIDSTDTVHLFCSSSGSVWEPMNAAPRDAPEIPACCGKIVTLLGNPKDDSLLAVCENGYVITFPGCPKCVKAANWERHFVKGRIEGDVLRIDCTDGDCITVLLAAVQQVRVGWKYAAALLQQGGTLIDLRDEDAQPTLPGAVNQSLAQAMYLLKGGAYSGQPVFFFCYTGSQADIAAATARKIGYACAYSLGGQKQILETNDGIWPEAL